jgi:nucleoside-diphosphate-sugar epimerase
MAKRAGVEPFLFSASCSLYGAHGDTPLDETAEFHPVTPYGESKVLSERDLHALVDDDIGPAYLRKATDTVMGAPHVPAVRAVHAESGRQARGAHA